MFGAGCFSSEPLYFAVIRLVLYDFEFFLYEFDCFWSFFFVFCFQRGLIVFETFNLLSAYLIDFCVIDPKNRRF